MHVNIRLSIFVLCCTKCDLSGFHRRVVCPSSQRCQVPKGLRLPEGPLWWHDRCKKPLFCKEAAIRRWKFLEMLKLGPVLKDDGQKLKNIISCLGKIRESHPLKFFCRIYDFWELNGGSLKTNHRARHTIKQCKLIAYIWHLTIGRRTSRSSWGWEISCRTGSRRRASKRDLRDGWSWRANWIE